jgi:hypothetical protein
MKRILTTALGLAMLLGSINSIGAQPGNQTQGFPYKGWKKPKPQPKYYYVVTLRHPVTGGEVFSTRYDDQKQAQNVYSMYSRYHWKVWKFVGIGEPTHDRMFTNYYDAKNYQIPPSFFGPFPKAIESQSVKAGYASIQKLEYRGR